MFIQQRLKKGDTTELEEVTAVEGFRGTDIVELLMELL
jgi:hypothetical protein